MSSVSDGVNPDDSPKADDLPGTTPSLGKQAYRRGSGAVEIVEQFLAATSGPMQDPFIAKLEPKHITKTLEIAEKRVDNELEFRKSRLASEDKRYQITLTFAGGVVVAILIVVWLLLHYGKTDQVVQLFTMLFVGGGGIGIGKSLNRPTVESSTLSDASQSE